MSLTSLASMLVALEDVYLQEVGEEDSLVTATEVVSDFWSNTLTMAP